jgi:peptidoglycan/LPS O-acetylase OafA/YrhL
VNVKVPARYLDWAIALAEAAVVILSGTAAYRLAGAESNAALPAFLLVSGAVAAAWILLLNPWSRWRLPRLSRAVSAAGLSVLTAIALVMTGLFWWAALLVLGGVLLAMTPVLRPDSADPELSR